MKTLNLIGFLFVHAVNLIVDVLTVVVVCFLFSLIDAESQSGILLSIAIAFLVFSWKKTGGLDFYNPSKIKEYYQSALN